MYNVWKCVCCMSGGVECGDVECGGVGCVGVGCGM